MVGLPYALGFHFRLSVSDSERGFSSAQAGIGNFVTCQLPIRTFFHSGDAFAAREAFGALGASSTAASPPST